MSEPKYSEIYFLAVGKKWALEALRGFYLNMIIATTSLCCYNHLLPFSMT